MGEQVVRTLPEVWTDLGRQNEGESGKEGRE